MRDHAAEERSLLTSFHLADVALSGRRVAAVAGGHGGELGAGGHGGELWWSVFDDGPAVGQHQGEWARRNFL